MASVLQKCFFVAVSVFFCVSRGVVALKIVSLEVPDEVSRGESARLACTYELEGETLYSVKWYKDNVEFFRYIPSHRPQGQFFPAQGVEVDHDLSGNGNVVIRDISRSTAGVYMCEVSTDAPYFGTVVAEKRMSVKESFVSKSSGHYGADRSTINMLLVTILLILQSRYHMW